MTPPLPTPPGPGLRKDHRLTFARGSILPVLGWNVLSGLQFLLQPGRFTSSFDLSGDAGQNAIRSVGLLFLMWSIPSAIALVHPFRNWSALLAAVLMQALGLVGEILILVTLPDLLNARSSLQHFIPFDAAGLVLLVMAAGMTRQ